MRLKPTPDKAGVCTPESGECYHCGNVGPWSMTCDNKCGCHSPKPTHATDWEGGFERWLGDEFDKQNKGTSGQTNRWLFCWNGEQDNEPPFDCACCLTDPSSEWFNKGCGCICHIRISQIKSFIRATREQARKEMWKECKEAVEDIDPCSDSGGTLGCSDHHYTLGGDGLKAKREALKELAKVEPK